MGMSICEERYVQYLLYNKRRTLLAKDCVYLFFSVYSFQGSANGGKIYVKNITSCSRDHLDMAKTSMDDLKSDILY